MCNLDESGNAVICDITAVLPVQILESINRQLTFMATPIGRACNFRRHFEIWIKGVLDTLYMLDMLDFDTHHEITEHYENL